ncbi:ornithine delta aminotransferase, partial [Trifolium medium]|nr:ornithine delta aminotransferase [Trifolium medium]
MLKLSFFSFYVTVHSTFGGNPLASAVAIASLEVIKEERLTE